ncbi:MAG: ribosome small subunit-dependent GTPase A [Eubacterium sp.]|nr:ribosome small subunit-dependent GTPase A [Eubacterium sp.]
MQKQGKIIKGIAGFYYVLAEEILYECKAKGVFRNKSIKPLVGDNVTIDVIDDIEHKGNIAFIEERENELIRPAVANVDQAMIVFALKQPNPNLNLLDKFLVMMEFQNIETIICFNKKDIADETFMEQLKTIYNNAGYRVIFASATEDEGVETIKRFLENKTTVFAGPSGVGKSSMLNALTKNYTMETGSVSKKIGRGKHTTRHSELFEINKNSFVFDTPGFSSLFVPGMVKERLEDCFPEFGEYVGKCRFIGCAHLNEPDCAVKTALEDEKISISRYENYKLMYQELKEKEKRYD